ncbi:MAG TPA: hypothetical protein VKZ49_10260 [Polyangiaceae bacterium]|nr:hypothetical protein [Polyangiaceae bacterium]
MNPRSGLECLAARLGRSGLPVAAALALTTACARQPAKAPAKQPAAPQAALDGRRWLLEDVERASRAGAEPSEVIALDAGAPGDRISSVVELPADACVLLMARASASIDDVDLYAYADDGTLIGSDEAPEKTATLLLCPPHPRRVFVSARVAAGHGLVALGSQRVSVEHAPKVAAAVGAKGRSGADPDQGAALWSGLDDAISEHRRSIGGQWQLLRKLPILVDPRVPARVSAEVEAESCLDVLVVPSEQTAYLDVLAIDDQGRILGRADSGADDTRSLIVCSPVRAPVTLELRPHAGQGLTAVIISRSAKSTPIDPDWPVVRFELAPTGSIAEARKRAAESLRTQGYGGGRRVAGGDLVLGERKSVAVPLRAGCSRVEVLTGKPVRAVDTFLWSAAGDLVASERGSGQTSLFTCGPGGAFRLDIEPLTQAGPFAVELRAEPAAPEPLLQHPLAAGRLLARLATLGAAAPSSLASETVELTLSPNALSRTPLRIAGGACADVVLALERGASGAELRLLSPAGDELAFARGTSVAHARSCALESARPSELVIEARAAAGQAPALLSVRRFKPSR